MAFEDEFSEKQKDMIALALEYVERVKSTVDTVYIYCAHENSTYSFDLFFKVGTKILWTHQLAKNVDRSLIFQVLELGTQDFQDIDTICQKYHQPSPTQIKLIYDNVSKKVHANYSYDLFDPDSEFFISDAIFKQWIEEVKKEVEG